MYGEVLTSSSENRSRNSCVMCTEDFAHHTSIVIENEIIGGSSTLDPITSVSETKNQQTGIVQLFLNFNETIGGFCSADSLTSSYYTPRETRCCWCKRLVSEFCQHPLTGLWGVSVLCKRGFNARRVKRDVIRRNINR